ncbi:DUF5658 family protein [Heyndrickxia sp. NPDC080065]|uniref:DUF5658 family protein n=1 Tax=Heyndrickxia sp. NPDC080065 TaxID=3390568 RepID=UPI003CFCDE5D
MTFAFHLLALLNVFDAFISFIGLRSGWIEEANPLMRYFYNIHPILFLGIKISFSLFNIYTYLYSKNSK